MTGRARALFVDRDGTLMEDVGYCSDPRHVRVFDGAGDALRRARARGLKVVLVTNQSGIGRGWMSVAQFDAVQAELARQLGPGALDVVYHCPDAPDAGSPRRKPAPGMLLDAARDHGFDLKTSWMVGDKPSDIEAGRNAGTRTVLVRTGYGAGQEATGADAVARDVVDAVDRVILGGSTGAAAIVIPARHRSVRFPGKPLFVIAGKPLVRWVWERCRRVRGCDRVLVATDDTRIADAARAFGAEVAMTSARHRTGTERVAEVAGGLPEGAVVLNVQGDEPLISPRLLERMLDTMRAEPGLDMITAAAPFGPGDDPADPNRVKVVMSAAGDALYFSRAPIPADRDGAGVRRHLHLGVYGYRREFLLRLVRLPMPPAERAERLEQLRALHHGARVRVLTTRGGGFGVDTPADAARMGRILGRRR